MIDVNCLAEVFSGNFDRLPSPLDTHPSILQCDYDPLYISGTPVIFLRFPKWLTSFHLQCDCQPRLRAHHTHLVPPPPANARRPHAPLLLGAEDHRLASREIVAMERQRWTKTESLTKEKGCCRNVSSHTRTMKEDGNP